jgi:flagellar basal-body rod protein FlgB
MLIEGMLNRGSMPVLEQVMNFTEARHEVLVNNISNFDTPGYKVKDLPAEEFFSALREAVTRRDQRGAGDPLTPRSTRNLKWDSLGRLKAQAVELKDNNILFHDNNNRFVEKQLSSMAQNALRHNIAAELLKGKYESLHTAIRGRL